MKTTRYAAFLGGINVGGTRKVPMADLKAVLEKEGFIGVKTLLASGNVVFDAPAGQGEASIKEALEVAIGRRFSFQVRVHVRSAAHIAKLVASDPFKSAATDAKAKHYVTFLPSADRLEAFTTVDLGGEKGTVDMMTKLSKEYGRAITTRSWDTVLKVAAAC